jgi:broad specificity phosphatase PhoE
MERIEADKLRLMAATTTFYLIRHAANEYIGKAIAGWLPGVQLNAEGQQQAEELARLLCSSPIRHIYSSPLERARETAAPLAKRLALEVRLSDAIGELKFGEWTGNKMDSLAADPRWQQWNSFRSGARAPQGEMMIETQARFVGFMEELRAAHQGSHIALFTHGDPVRAAVLYYLGMPLDFLHRIEISLASVTMLRVSDSGPELLCLNFRSQLLSPCRPA